MKKPKAKLRMESKDDFYYAFYAEANEIAKVVGKDFLFDVIFRNNKVEREQYVIDVFSQTGIKITDSGFWTGFSEVFYDIENGNSLFVYAGEVEDDDDQLEFDF